MENRAWSAKESVKKAGRTDGQRFAHLIWTRYPGPAMRVPPGTWPAGGCWVFPDNNHED